MPLPVISERQKDALTNSTARINIFEGPVRAGKTYSSLLRWIDFCFHGPKGELLVTGRSQSSLKRNFINPMIELLGSPFQYFEGKREIHYAGRIMYVIGANDERATGKIQGSTFAGAWADEATLLPESFFKMLLSRLSVEGAQLFATTNPDSPLHWLKTDYIDRADELDLKSFKFVIDDNPSLTDSYKNNLKKEYQGLWYRRYILGEWCLAEGSVYDFFDESLHVRTQAPTWAKEYYLSIDYGTHNPFCALLIGYNNESHPALWVEKEYYYDSKLHGRQKTDAEYYNDIKQRFYDLYPIKITYCDPSAASFIVECKKQGKPIVQGNNDVLDGIRTVSNLLMSGDLVIVKECANLIKEIFGYVWDSRSVKLGEDKPMKIADHGLDSLRYFCHTHFGSGKAINTIKKEPARDHLRDTWTQPGWRYI